MSYHKFILYNVVGGIMWVALCLLAGVWLGSKQVVREHFSLVVLAIVIISVLPMAVSLWSARRDARRAAEAGTQAGPPCAPPNTAPVTHADRAAHAGVQPLAGARDSSPAS
jgi:hypothetical protein